MVASLSDLKEFYAQIVQGGYTIDHVSNHGNASVAISAIRKTTGSKCIGKRVEIGRSRAVRESTWDFQKQRFFQNWTQ